MSSSIPATDGYVNLSLLDGGSMTGLTSLMHAGSPPDQFRLYDWVFYAYNPKKDRHLVWDLGMAALEQRRISSIRSRGLLGKIGNNTTKRAGSPADYEKTCHNTIASRCGGIQV
ncbi:uncharacterized protein N7469_001095 [Penicillium citrinum]|uniref:Uncharacterized protein n=2 Tax=Penicillium TaxID=5073 RepID=A0A9W9TVJ2_PENCI|nr:uncharacterized protein N7469_001095 [Penicillium citrinum]KAJ5242768.1 hypothetical protein N7469_001095 [Penicillium citrinum]KAJ5599724.1 hypothetical protein N7450_000791 [Penicillium hetheringtonii]